MFLSLLARNRLTAVVVLGEPTTAASTPEVTATPATATEVAAASAASSAAESLSAAPAAAPATSAKTALALVMYHRLESVAGIGVVVPVRRRCRARCLLCPGGRRLRRRRRGCFATGFGFVGIPGNFHPAVLVGGRHRLVSGLRVPRGISLLVGAVTRSSLGWRELLLWFSGRADGVLGRCTVTLLSRRRLLRLNRSGIGRLVSCRGGFRGLCFLLSLRNLRGLLLRYLSHSSDCVSSQYSSIGRSRMALSYK